MTDKCKDCPIRKFYANVFDAQFYGKDGPFICEKEEGFNDLKVWHRVSHGSRCGMRIVRRDGRNSGSVLRNTGRGIHSVPHLRLV